MWSRNALACCSKQSRACVQLRSRTLATVTDAAGPSSTPASTPKPSLSKSSQSPRPTIQTAVILNRSPIVTRTPSAFERAYYAYQARIQRALFNPFPDEFYFKPGSILEDQFNAEEKQREKLAFGGPYVKEKPVEVLGSEEGAGRKQQQPMPRIHEADIKMDVQSLDRQGERNLYLLVHGKDSAGKDVWRFPQGGIEEGQALHQAAEQDLYIECGELMDAWVVSRNPIGVIEPNNASTPSQQACVFFYKAHILAGQAKPNGKTVKDFAWLTKEEIESRVDQQYWAAVKDMLSDF
ncbi:39S mitochondrial ribosomal protein L46-domain-containing protein [Fomitopsis serialis]|uniref:39S mitochondrial ribosomal protein L46-domain-containing protein n=1 Tax=Fomitopsis serialis TaxID=139415 RepID=UPI0020077E8A|nr:39S mitochondrial ribosomal protein L46-domain-containing protein [Neoantrodia serialis]KAH9925274.1 39S mitochondrial ribosomal protein L46-domain-containing protein [Neoantrodia serialis]